MEWFEQDDVRLATVCCRPSGDRWQLTLRRPTVHPPERVWTALTRPDLLARWAPAVPDRPLDRPGPVLLTLPTPDGDAGARAGGDAGGPVVGPERREATVLSVQAGAGLAVSMPDDELDWTLDPTDGGTAITLRHTFLDPDWACELAASWHEHLDALDRVLAGCEAAAASAVPPPRHLLRLAYGQQLALAAPLFDD